MHRIKDMKTNKALIHLQHYSTVQTIDVFK